jgi:hypothetical protein
MSDIPSSSKIYLETFDSILADSKAARRRVVTTLNDGDVERYLSGPLFDNPDGESQMGRDTVLQEPDFKTTVLDRIAELQAAKATFDTEVAALTQRIEQSSDVVTAPANSLYRTLDFIKNETLSAQTEMSATIAYRITLLQNTARFLEEIQKEGLAQRKKRFVRSEGSGLSAPGPYEQKDAGELSAGSGLSEGLSYATTLAELKASAPPGPATMK